MVSIFGVFFPLVFGVFGFRIVFYFVVVLKTFLTVDAIFVQYKEEEKKQCQPIKKQLKVDYLVLPEGKSDEQFVLKWHNQREWKYHYPYYLPGILRATELEEWEGFDKQDIANLCNIHLNGRKLKILFGQFDSSWAVLLSRISGKSPQSKKICKMCGNNDPEHFVPGIKDGVFDFHVECWRYCGYTSSTYSKLFVEKLFIELPTMLDKDNKVYNKDKVLKGMILGVIIRIFDAATNNQYVKQREKIHNKKQFVSPCCWDRAYNVDWSFIPTYQKFYDWIDETGTLNLHIVYNNKK